MERGGGEAVSLWNWEGGVGVHGLLKWGLCAEGACTDRQTEPYHRIPA